MSQKKQQVQAISLLPKQHDFVYSDARETLYSGAFGSGKSRATCVKLLLRASVKGAREALVRKHLVTLKATTLKTLLEPEGDLPPVLMPGTYHHNKTDRTIDIYGGGQIFYTGLDTSGDKATKQGSLNLTGAGVDQAEELSADDWRMLRSRCRMPVNGLKNQIYGACNPDAPTHHLAIRFGLDGIHEIAKNCRVIKTKSTDNRFLPDDYVEDLLTLTGIYKRRYVDGEWCGAEGLIYDKFERQLFVREREGVSWRRIIIGGDIGYTNPTALLVICQDERGGIHVADEFYRTKQTESQIVAAAERFRSQYGASSVVIDPAAAAVRASMEREGLHVVAGDNEVFGGIGRVQKLFVLDGDNRPLITISPKCEKLIREFGAYEWMDGKDKPRKENDHACDALRYGVMHLQDSSGFLEVRCFGSRDPRDAARERNRQMGLVDDGTWQTVWSQDGSHEFAALRRRSRFN